MSAVVLTRTNIPHDTLCIVDCGSASQIEKHGARGRTFRFATRYPGARRRQEGQNIPAAYAQPLGCTPIPKSNPFTPWPDECGSISPIRVRRRDSTSGGARPRLRLRKANRRVKRKRGGKGWRSPPNNIDAPNQPYEGSVKTVGGGSEVCRGRSGLQNARVGTRPCSSLARNPDNGHIYSRVY